MTSRKSAQSDIASNFSSKIVMSYVSHNRLPVSDLPALIGSIYQTIDGLSCKGGVPIISLKLKPLIAINKTVTKDYIISPEDGRRYRTLKRHLAGRGLTPDQYRKKWNLPHDYPMTAANYAAERSAIAKATGLGNRRPTQATPTIIQR